METFNALVEASRMSEMSNTKQSRGVADYYLNEVRMQPDELPMMSYGLQLNRLAEAPPTGLVDTESKLKNQFDILSKSGYVYKHKGEAIADHGIDRVLPVAEAHELPNADTFFSQTAGRDYKSFGSVCDRLDDGVE